MHRKWLGILISGCLGTQLCAGAQPMAEVGTTPTDVLDEVLVRGARLSDLKAAIVEAEDRFYARYNELNTTNVFDIECVVDRRTGTKLKRRICLTKLQRKAMSDQGREYQHSLQDTTIYVDAGALGLGKPPDTDPRVVWDARYEEFRNNMLDLLKQNPELRRLADESEEAGKRYDAERKRRRNDG
jgi:hypothetical protein